MGQAARIDLEAGLPEVVDYGNAPITYVSALARVDGMGADALFAFWAWRTTMLDGRVRRQREVVLNLMMPACAIGSGIEMTMTTMGPSLIVPSLSRPKRFQL